MDNNSKDSVRLRRRAISGGRQSLYLDIYVNGRRNYEFLKLYIEPERTRADRKKNEETMQLAEAIRGKRLVDVQNRRYGFESAYRLDTNFLDYYRSMCEKRLGEMSRGGGELGQLVELPEAPGEVLRENPGHHVP